MLGDRRSPYGRVVARGFQHESIVAQMAGEGCAQRSPFAIGERGGRMRRRRKRRRRSTAIKSNGPNTGDGEQLTQAEIK